MGYSTLTSLSPGVLDCTYKKPFGGGWGVFFHISAESLFVSSSTPSLRYHRQSRCA